MVDANQAVPVIESIPGIAGNLFGQSISFIQNELISGLFTFDPTAIAIAGIIGIILVVLIFNVSKILYTLLKKLFLFLIIGFSLYFFMANYGAKLAAEGGLTGQLIVVGIVGIALGLIALIISISSVAKHGHRFRKERREKAEEIKEETREQLQSIKSAPKVTPTQISQPDFLSQQALTTKKIFSSIQDDRSLLAVLSYVIIAQFGVFSSKTIHAPNAEIGMIFFGVFFLGAFIFIRTTYHNYIKGVSHLLVASVFGVILSVILAHFWTEIPLETVLSMAYFETDAVVALVTSIAVSLLMGSKD
jgi:hypothetical protein